MSYQHQIGNTINTPAGSIPSQTNNYSAGQHAGISATITGGATTDFPNTAVDVSQAVAVVMYCSRDVQIKINDDGSPSATINLLAGVPLVWTDDGYFSSPIGSEDWTTVRAVLASGDDAQLIIDVLYD